MTLHTFAFLAGLAVLAGLTTAVGHPMCRPTLALKDVRFSPMQPPSMQRKWTAVVTVDASGCAANSHGCETRQYPCRSVIARAAARASVAGVFSQRSRKKKKGRGAALGRSGG